MYRPVIVIVLLVILGYTDGSQILKGINISVSLNYNQTGEVICNICDCWMEKSDSTLLVDCANRSLTKLPKFIKSWEVSRLDLSGNRLKEVPKLPRIHYSTLRMLNLSNNQIDSVTQELFFLNLTEIYLHNNRIKEISGRLLRQFEAPNIKVITLHGNPWTCECDSKTIQVADFIQRQLKNHPELNDVTCAQSKFKLADLTVGHVCRYPSPFLVAGFITCIFLVYLMFYLCLTTVIRKENDELENTHLD